MFNIISCKYTKQSKQKEKIKALKYNKLPINLYTSTDK